jgi:hypothetical protein
MRKNSDTRRSSEAPSAASTGQELTDVPSVLVLRTARTVPFAVRCDLTGEVLPVVRPGHLVEDLRALTPQLLQFGVQF